MFVTVDKFNNLFGFCIDDFHLVKVAGNPQQMKAPLFSANDVLGWDIDLTGAALIFDDPDKNMWSFQDLYDHDYDWLKEMVYDGDYLDNIEIFISPENVKSIIKLKTYSRYTVIENVIENSPNRILYYLSIHLKINYSQMNTNTLYDEVKKSLYKLSNKRFYKAISEIVIARIKSND